MLLFQDTSIPEKVRAFEAGFVDGLGEKGGGVHLSAKDRELAQQTKKKWAFNKVKQGLVLGGHSNREQVISINLSK